ncbi:MAG: tetratricopeptide repeat protein [Myxococcales bacterium]|nr:tetratricopeptide repeat protein [Myxococcales bacterium]
MIRTPARPRHHVRRLVSHTLQGVALMVLLPSLLTACAARVAVVDTLPPEPVSEPIVAEYDFEPVLVRGTVHEDGTVSTVAYDLPLLFTEANDYLRAGDNENALRLYTLILDNFDDPSFLPVTHYNTGLALEALDRIDEAATHYEVVIQNWPHSEDGIWSRFRLAEIRFAQSRWSDILPLMDQILIRSTVTHLDRVEAHVRSGSALLEMRRLSDAASHFQRAIDLNSNALQAWNPSSSPESQEPLAPGHALIARSHFGLGRVYHELFSDIRLVLPQEQITQDLVDKGQLFERAESSYVDAVRTGHPYWAPAAGFMVGQMYEDFYFDILACEMPSDFDALHREVYFEELRELIQPSLDRAMNVYENNLAMCYRIGAENEWTERTLESIQRVRDYNTNQTGWEEEQQLIFEQRHPRSARFGDVMEFRSEASR